MATTPKPQAAGAPAPAPEVPLKSTEEWSQGFYSGSPTGDGAATGTALPTNAPVAGFWERLRHGVEGKSRLGEIARSIPRGLANVGNALHQTGAEMVAAGKDALDIGGTEAQQDQARVDAKSSRLVSEEDLNMTYGARSDDPLASFTETAVQGASAMLLFSATGAGVIGGAALTDATAFDPYEAGLSEIAAQYGDRVPGIGGILKAAGDLGTVDEQDSFLTSRIKRAVEGGIVGAGFDAVFWSAKKVLGLRAKSPEMVAEADTKLTQIVDGQHTPEGAMVVARPNEDGTWRVEPANEADFIPATPREAPPVDPLSPSERTLIERGALTSDSYTQDIVEGAGHRYLGAEDAPTYDFLPGPKDAPGRHVYRVPGKAVLIVREGADGLPAYPTLMFTKPEARGSKLAQGLLKDAQADFKAKGLGPIGINAGDLSPMRVEQLKKHGTQGRPVFDPDTKEIAERVREPALVPGPARGNPRNPMTASETAAHELGYDHPRFADRAEAEAQAVTMNVHMAQKQAAGKPRLFSPAQVAKHDEIAQRLFTTKDAAEAQRLIDGTDFNFQYLGGSDRVRAQIEALSEQFRGTFDRARKLPGVPNDHTIKLATALAKQYGMRDFAQAFHGTADEVRHLSVRLLLGNRAVVQLGERIGSLAQLRRQRPHDPVLLQEARELLQTHLELARDVAGVNSEVGRSLQVLQARSHPDVQDIKIGDKASVEPKGAKPKAAPNKSQSVYDNLKPEEIDAALRMYERAGGSPRNAQAIIDGLRVVADAPKGKVSRVIEAATNVFINSLISGAKTFETIFASGQVMLHFEYVNRMLAGAASLNPKLAREGADMLYAHYAYALDNVKSASAAFRENRSVIDPSPTMYATGGVVNSVVSLPGRTAGTIDEFTRVTGYRAFERAKALRQARAEGLNGAALVKRVEADVKASIDPQHGVGLNPKALEFAGVPTLSDPLGAGTFSGDLSNMLAKYPATKFVVPFIRPGVNTFRYVGKATPGINLFYKDVRETLARGGEDAAVLMTRTVLAGSMYAYAWSKCVDGTITGRGPSDERLRNEWLKNHQPYSVKIGGVYKSYRRMEPFGTFLGLAADAHMVQLEVANDEGTSGEDIGKAVFASVLANTVNKSYMQGLSTFLTAVDDQDLSSASKFLGGVVGGYVPQAVQQFNDDMYYREARTLLDEVYKRTPGLSDELPPKFNFLGEPVMKQGSLWNRNFSIAREADASASLVEDTLVRDGIRLSPPPDKEFNGAIDFKDKRWAKDGKLPYVRWMELMSGGWGEREGLRTKLETVVKSETYQKATAGTATYPGGERGIIVASIKDAWEDAAKQQMLREFPDLQRAWKGAAGLKGAALQGGQPAVDTRRIRFGIPTP